VSKQKEESNSLFQPLELPCGVILKNRIIKSAMSDSLANGCGNPTDLQCKLYQRWAEGGLAASIIGEVQGNPNYAEKPGNLVLNHQSDHSKFKELAQKGSINKSQLWVQLGHAGAMSHLPISTPKGPSEINIPGLDCEALTLKEIKELPAEFARTAILAKDLGFGGIQIHAAHGFLLSQFLSPLFNKRTDEYGGSIQSRMKILLEVIVEVRHAVGRQFPIAIKLNATDMLEGGLEPIDSLKVISELENTSADLIDISGGTYFPGAKSASDKASKGPYFLDYAKQARKITKKPIMVTGGFKSFAQATDALIEGNIDVVGLARAFALQPSLPMDWQKSSPINSEFPRFSNPPEGGITAWYTMRLTQIAEGQEEVSEPDLETAIKIYEERDAKRCLDWNKHFFN